MMARVDCRRLGSGLGSDLAGPDWIDPGLVGCLAGRFAVRVAAHLAAGLVARSVAVRFVGCLAAGLAAQAVAHSACQVAAGFGLGFVAAHSGLASAGLAGSGPAVGFDLE